MGIGRPYFRLSTPLPSREAPDHGLRGREFRRYEAASASASSRFASSRNSFATRLRAAPVRGQRVLAASAYLSYLAASSRSWRPPSLIPRTVEPCLLRIPTTKPRTISDVSIFSRDSRTGTDGQSRSFVSGSFARSSPIVTSHTSSLSMLAAADLAPSSHFCNASPSTSPRSFAPGIKRQS